MNILLLGGTAWLGRTIAETAVAAGHDVSCVARGTDAPAGVTLVQADRDEDHALASLTAPGTARWDAVIDVARQPGYVRRAVHDLAAHAERYVYISSCNVYASLASYGIDEAAPLNTALTSDVMASPDEYGAAKVACEEAVLAGFGADRTIIIRPGLIGGPGDPTGRSSYWPLRFARPSNPQAQVLVPDAAQQLTSVIDVRDLAAWIMRLLEQTVSGIFNAAGNPTPLGEHLAIARRLADHKGSLVGASPEWLASQDVAQWSGPRSFPLWLADPEARGIGALSNESARATGLVLRPLTDTLSDTLAWANSCGIATVTRSGLTDDEECELLGELGRA
ncbi:NAD-dependent epimerase/dehydratase family protein [Leucobacter viscericola]|uniref:NAD-dependent epimerase/dehydratase family protein n=1 Tax=Leucobacter viscericola TaxID=2714935 RepID=A0A6G7XCT1_9MICO|nr:NAD-dependent epimerase/dehydratase family protein [Leucobacter viscericola]QIK62178.1 NAD-dependent epimerase/dehydratase family protein [Leucobacter viscericola]